MFHIMQKFYTQAGAPCSALDDWAWYEINGVVRKYRDGQTRTLQNGVWVLI